MKTEIKHGKDIEYAASCIRSGGLVAFPTETVYGLGADAFNAIAAARIFEVKQRPSFDPLIVHIHSYDDINLLFCKKVNSLVRKLAEAFWPGPLTIVHPKSERVPDIITSGLDTVAVRMPSSKVALELIKLSNTPIAAPSANRFGQLSPTRPEHVLKQLKGIDYLLEGEAGSVGIESTVVSVQDDYCVVLRPGGISFEELNTITPCKLNFAESENHSYTSPGLLKSHYSPNKPLHILSDLSLSSLPEGAGLILHSQPINPPPEWCRVIYTSRTYNLVEVAASLFSALHSFEDNPDVNQIYIQSVEEKGLGRAIMDRIKKAAFRYS